jgi:hypothetical protein
MSKSSLKISDSAMSLLRDAAEESNRSLAGQAEHWMRLGRQIDAARTSVVHPDVARALNAKVSVDALPGELQEQFFDEFSGLMAQPTVEEEAFFAAMRAKGGAVGYRSPDSDDVVRLAPGGAESSHALPELPARSATAAPASTSQTPLTFMEEEALRTKRVNAALEQDRRENGVFFVRDGYVHHTRPDGVTIKMESVAEYLHAKG